MATNNILSFCAGANPNVLTPTDWQTTPARSSGFVSGIALSSHVNTAVVGGANIAHAVGEFIKNQLNEDVNPTDETALVSQFLRSLQVFIQPGGLYYKVSTRPDGRKSSLTKSQISLKQASQFCGVFFLDISNGY